MRSYLIEDLFEADIEKIKGALNEMQLQGPLEGIYYLPLPTELLQQEQKDHQDECGPYFMALEIIEGASDMSECQLKLELLTRARNKIRCSCVNYATHEQRKHMIEYLDQFIEELEISV
ncbi:hypothetical protein GM415_13955 [Pseudodesulfovibrio cashew]|uniref:Uncharacterized protein n=1 Tax=Pseudodesulfovibrio cashew TaxID=2678688 RepID=A0A6I6JEB1_9BACT|nr:hypothetical protein [Pseudodesulfovibrio cashew]QGY41186.1 hypothetical protein GM415_13955 [Pseudodesulfovibrio cashew]